MLYTYCSGYSEFSDFWQRFVSDIVGARTVHGFPDGRTRGAPTDLVLIARAIPREVGLETLFWQRDTCCVGF